MKIGSQNGANAPNEEQQHHHAGLAAASQAAAAAAAASQAAAAAAAAAASSQQQQHPSKRLAWLGLQIGQWQDSSLQGEKVGEEVFLFIAYATDIIVNYVCRELVSQSGGDQITAEDVEAIMRSQFGVQTSIESETQGQLLKTKRPPPAVNEPATAAEVTARNLSLTRSMSSRVRYTKLEAMRKFEEKMMTDHGHTSNNKSSSSRS